MTDTASPTTKAFRDLPPDIQSTCLSAVGKAPLSYVETLLLVGREILKERERCLEAVRRAPALDENGYIAEKGAVMNEIMRGEK